MRFQTELVPARLVKRYKRFLADCELEGGRIITAHCANPGSMLGLAGPGTRVWLEPNDDPKKKLKFGWRLVDFGNDHFACVDTSLANKVVKEALLNGLVPGLTNRESVKAEVKYGQSSRIDFLVNFGGDQNTYVEVKSVTLSRSRRLAEFPDSVTKRGAKHLAELEEMRRQGHRALMLYLVQRTDCTKVTLAKDIDPNYTAAFIQARDAGVDVLALQADITPEGIEVGKPLDFVL
ncbi:MAG: DNA/RNA nuclease SfsA [Pseudomonadota bacterium]